MATLGIEQIEKILPHRYPMLLIDRVLELEPGKRVVTIKNLTTNDHFFQGHFPGAPIMPGTLIVEAMAQASILLYHSAYKEDLKNTPKYYLGSIKARFSHPVFPGDQLRIESETVKLLSTGAYVTARAFVGDKQAAEADLIFAIKR